MNRFTIKGARKETAESVELSIVAASKNDAETIASNMGVLVSDITKERKPKRRKYVIFSVIAVAVLGFVVIGTSISGPSSSGPSSSSNTRTVTLAPIQAYKLYLAYQRNEVQADNEYKGKLILIVGMISSIGKNITGTPYVMLQTSGHQVFGIQCMFSDPQEIKKLGKLQRGHWVSIAGWGGGSIGNVIVDNCTLVANKQVYRSVSLKYHSG